MTGFNGYATDDLLGNELFLRFLKTICHSYNDGLEGRTVSAVIFCAEITAGKLQRLKEITTAVGKSKHEF
jgi:hypothetical protein